MRKKRGDGGEIESAAWMYTALLTLPDPMEADGAYQGCLPFCKHAILRLHTCVTQFQDCTRVPCNIGILRICNTILRLCKFSNCVEHMLA